MLPIMTTQVYDVPVSFYATITSDVKAYLLFYIKHYSTLQVFAKLNDDFKCKLSGEPMGL